MTARRGPPCRAFTLLDAMILVVGAAVGFAGLRGQFGGRDMAADWKLWSDEILGYSLMLLSGVLLALRLRRPRPPLRRLACQPGAVACFGAVAYGLVYDVQYLVVMAIRPDQYGSLDRTSGEWVWWLIETPSSEFAWIVPISWILTRLARRRRPERGWVDRSGRILGWSWIAWAVASPFLP